MVVIQGTYYKLQGLKEDRISTISTSSPSSSSLSGPSESMIHASQSNQRQPFRRLIYPIPSVGGLGIHATIDLMGQVKFGPDVGMHR